MKRILAMLLTVHLLLSAAGPALAHAEALPSSQPSASIQDAAALFLQAEMQRQAEKAAEATDGWSHFLFAQGLSDITLDLESYDPAKDKPLAVSFLMAGGQPRIKEQPAYSGDSLAWLKGVVASMVAHDTLVKTNLTITLAGGGYTAQFAPRAEAALQKSVRSIAAKALKACDSDTLAAVMVDHLMPTPIAVPKGAPDTLDAANYQAAFLAYLQRNAFDLSEHPIIPTLLYGIKGYQLNVNSGPGAFHLTYTVPNLDTLFGASVTALDYALCHDTQAREYSDTEVYQMLVEQMEKDMAAYRHSKDSSIKKRFTFDFLDLTQRVHPIVFYADHEGNENRSLETALADIRLAIDRMPDSPPLPYPQSGLISGSSKGTECTFSAPNDGYARSVSVYNRKTGELYATLFVAGGRSVTVRIPKGSYDFIVGVGNVWYGEPHLFSHRGAYRKLENMSIHGSGYYHTFSLSRNDGGYAGSYGLSYSDVFE